MQRTLVLLKPDAIQRGLVGEVTARLIRKGSTDGDENDGPQ